MKKEQILARFRALFPAVKLSNKRLNALAVKLEAKDLKDEAAVDAALNGANEINPFEDLAATDNTVANLKHQLKSQTTTDTDDDQEGNSSEGAGKGKGGNKDEPPAWAKSLLDSNKAMSEKLSSLEREKSQSMIAEKLKGNEKLKAIPAQFYKGRPLPEKEYGIDAWVTELEADWTEFAQDSNNSAFAKSSTPFASAAAGGGVSAAVEKYAAGIKANGNASAPIEGKKL